MIIQRLANKQLKKLHESSLEVMERTGVRFSDKKALDVLQRGGCEIVDGNRVRFPSDKIEWALKVCPEKIELFSQEGKPAINLSGKCAYYGNGSDLLYIIDHRTGERRKPILQDVKEMITLLDSLPFFDFVMSGFIPSDVPSDKVQKLQMLTMLEYTNKPIIYVTTDLGNTQAKIHMAEIAAGGAQALREKPFAVNYINIANPLKHNPESIQKLMWLSEKGLPFIYRPSIVTRGISTPVTWAGFLVVNNVAGLAGLVLSQLIKEGAPFIRCGCGGGTFDMQTMIGLHAAPEIRGFNEDMAEFYHLPRFGIGGLSGSKIVDQQAAYEAALTMITSTISGAQLIHDVGYMDNGTTGALDQLVICHEIIGWIKQYMKGLEITEETLALDLIDEVVVKDGDFLQSDNTLLHYRDDYYPELTERMNYDSWLAEGSLDLQERSRLAVDRILNDHKGVKLADSLGDEIKELI